MWKNALAMIVIGSLATGISSAAPLQVKKMFMKDQMIKSSLVSKNHTQNSESKFSGIWAGTCSYHNETDEVKIRIEENPIDLSIIDLMNEGNAETHSFNVLESDNRLHNEFYESSTSRLTRINENAIQFEGTELFATPSNKEKALVSGIYTFTLTVNNNELTMVTKMKLSTENNESVDHCVLKRVG